MCVCVCVCVCGAVQPTILKLRAAAEYLEYVDIEFHVMQSLSLFLSLYSTQPVFSLLSLVFPRRSLSLSLRHLSGTVVVSAAGKWNSN